MNLARPSAATERALAKNAESAKRNALKTWRSLRLCEKHNFIVRNGLSTFDRIIWKEFPVVTT